MGKNNVGNLHYPNKDVVNYWKRTIIYFCSLVICVYTRTGCHTNTQWYVAKSRRTWYLDVITWVELYQSLYRGLDLVSALGHCISPGIMARDPVSIPRADTMSRPWYRDWCSSTRVMIFVSYLMRRITFHWLLSCKPINMFYIEMQIFYSCIELWTFRRRVAHMTYHSVGLRERNNKQDYKKYFERMETVKTETN
jgi:hypothetical protein